MKKLVCFILCFALLLPTSLAFANADADNNNNETTVVISYEDALEMAIGEIIVLADIDIVLRDMQMQRRFLNDEVSRLRRYRQNWEIRAMEEMAWEVTSGLESARAAQAAIDAGAGSTIGDMNAVISGILAGVEGGEHLTPQLTNAIAGMVMMSTPDLSGQIMQLQMQQAQLNTELRRLRDDDHIEEMTRAAQRNLYEFDRQMDILRLGQEQARLSIEYALRGLIAALAELDVIEASLIAETAIVEETLRRTTIMHELGLVSAHDLSAVEHGMNQLETRHEELLRGRETLVQGINYMLGQPLTQDTVIELEWALPEMPEDLDEHTQEVMAEIHAVRQAGYEVVSAEDARWVLTGERRDINVTDANRRRVFDADRDRGRNLWRTYQTTDEEEIEELRERIVAQEAVERARTAETQTIRAAEAAITRAYTELHNLATQQETLLADLARAKADYEIIQTNLELGLITRFDAEQARMAIFRIEQDLERLEIQKWMQAFRWENPSLLQ